MIDWVNILLPFPHVERIHGGACVHYDEKGEGVRTTMKKMMQRGSFDNTVAIQTSTDEGHYRDGQHTHIWVSGSPKPLQGHNLFGTESPLELGAMLGKLALEKCGITVDAFTFRRWLSGRDVKLTRIDITYMLNVGGETDAAAWINAAANQVSAKYRPRSSQNEGTVYIGQHSRRWGLKFYSKFQEITCNSKKHRLPENIQSRDALLDYARGTVRVELVLQSMHLKAIQLQDGTAWFSQPQKAQDTWNTHMEKVQLSGNVRLHKNTIEQMPAHLRSTYALWQSGVAVKQILQKSDKNRMTYYRHRRDLLVYGIDIAKPRQDGNNVVPLIRVIEATPKATPAWAYNTPLYARAA